MIFSPHAAPIFMCLLSVIDKIRLLHHFAAILPSIPQGCASYSKMMHRLEKLAISHPHQAPGLNRIVFSDMPNDARSTVAATSSMKTDCSSIAVEIGIVVCKRS
ncbi:hypothetical protein BDBG_04656 [Blastomyces gilchristii SLH14081]|uniref:Uncharacterized protein n=2 Tax=Blastomyces TaxID=229219 RepID=A0A179ULZ9_BLAGS|nr:uncharacterized protein BDBG_04656 [Blastomyces gilchristii SLH14081]EQL37097.1 hypothetical protein BDFG_01394 [Blastomyces dermatitidis ATCC 26199]KMW69597.1 hypothetical protein BDDG_13741 [Blastomyces dermatitidis ATCC 18188]OAT09096.1 hypothetical protein BDBG_04656 [Blastomyces gilchristii SLH14081]